MYDTSETTTATKPQVKKSAKLHFFIQNKATKPKITV